MKFLLKSNFNNVIENRNKNKLSIQRILAMNKNIKNFLQVKKQIM